MVARAQTKLGVGAYTMLLAAVRQRQHIQWQAGSQAAARHMCGKQLLQADAEQPPGQASRSRNPQALPSNCPRRMPSSLQTGVGKLQRPSTAEQLHPPTDAKQLPCRRQAAAKQLSHLENGISHYLSSPNFESDGLVALPCGLNDLQWH